MRKISRREFIKGLGGLGIGALGGGALLSCVRREQAPPVAGQMAIELTEGEDYLRLEGGGVRCLGCLNRCIIEEGGRGICGERGNREGKLFSFEAEPPEGLKEAMWYRRLGNRQVQCQLCFRECLIPKGGRGFCRVRENREGRLYSLVYGEPCSLPVDPIELEPMYHMFPGHRNLCVATASCNFRCKHCQNWQITQRFPEEITSYPHSPEEIVERAMEFGCLSISHSINEPIVFYEYMLEIVKAAKERGERREERGEGKLLTLFHTNGSLNPDPLRELLQYMDGVTVDLKGFTDEFYERVSSAELEPVLRTLSIIKEEGVHLEIVNLVIPTLNDDLGDMGRMCEWIKENLGTDVPLHFTRFFPRYKMTHLPSTPIETLERAREIALEAGLKYVYIGNVPGHAANSTYCPKCGRRLIHRIHCTVLKNDAVGGRCKFCGERIPGVWEI